MSYANHSMNQVTGQVLHRRPYRETSYIVDFFTREYGKVSAVCKGVRGSKNDKKSLLQPFQPLTLNLFGRHELKNLSTVESAGSMFRLQGERLFSALYMNEVLNRTLLPEVQYQTLYDIYVASLLRLASDEALEPILREFELQLLEELGYGSNLQQDWQTGEALQPQAYYTFVVQQGLQQLSAKDSTQNCFSTEDLNKVYKYQWDKQSLRCAKVICRLALHPLLGDKPLKSRELFQ